MRRSIGLALGFLVVVACACGGRQKLARGVFERDLGGWKFIRFQQILDIEVWVAENPAVAYSASYVPRNALKRGQVDDRDVVSAVVTRYHEDDGIQPSLVGFVRRLAQESGYRVEEDVVSGVRLIRVAGHGEAWVLWVARGCIVKIGGRRDDVPAGLVSRYGEQYPSRLPPGSLERGQEPIPGATGPPRKAP